MPAKAASGPLEAAAAQDAAAASGGAPWPYSPRSIRVHPLTRQITLSTPSGDAGAAGASGAAGAAGASGASGVSGTPAPPPASSTSMSQRGDLEVRIECFDVDGEGTRAVGLLRLELVMDDRRLAVGPLNLNDLAVNRNSFDSTTRTYRVPVSVRESDRPAAGDQIEIRAILVTPEGAMLEDAWSFNWR